MANFGPTAKIFSAYGSQCSTTQDWELRRGSTYCSALLSFSLLYSWLPPMALDSMALWLSWSLFPPWRLAVKCMHRREIREAEANPTVPRVSLYKEDRGGAQIARITTAEILQLFLEPLPAGRPAIHTTRVKGLLSADLPMMQEETSCSKLKSYCLVRAGSSSSGPPHR